MDPLDRLCVAAREELERERSILESVGVTWCEPELIPFGNTVELKVEFFRSQDLIDIFEFCVCIDGMVTVSEDEVRTWFRENVPDVIRRLGGR